MLELRTQISATILFGLLAACATPEAPTCQESDLYIPIKRQHPQPGRRPGWVSVGLDVSPTGEVTRTFIIAEDAPQSFTANALRTLKRWQYCQLAGPDAAERVTYACVFSGSDDESLSQLQQACNEASPDEFGFLR